MQTQLWLKWNNEGLCYDDGKYYKPWCGRQGDAPLRAPCRCSCEELAPAVPSFCFWAEVMFFSGWSQPMTEQGGDGRVWPVLPSVGSKGQPLPWNSSLDGQRVSQVCTTDWRLPHPFLLQVSPLNQPFVLPAILKEPMPAHQAKQK